MKLSLYSAIVFFMIFFLQCATGPVQGGLITDIKFPGNINPENNVKSVKTGKGCQHSILLLASFGDAGAGSVAQKNGITKIATIDHSAFGILGLVYRNYCTIVAGE